MDFIHTLLIMEDDLDQTDTGSEMPIEFSNDSGHEVVEGQSPLDPGPSNPEPISSTPVVS